MRRPLGLSVLLACAAATVALPAAQADPAATAWVAVAASGRVERAEAGQAAAAWRAVHRGDSVPARTVVRTGDRGRATLTRGASILILDPATELELPASAGGSTVVQSSGTVLYEVHGVAETGFEVQTPYLVAGVKGTVFLVTVSETGAAVRVTEGVVEVMSLDGLERLDVRAGEQAAVEDGPNPRLESRQIAPDAGPHAHARTDALNHARQIVQAGLVATAAQPSGEPLDAAAPRGESKEPTGIGDNERSGSLDEGRFDTLDKPAGESGDRLGAGDDEARFGHDAFDDTSFDDDPLDDDSLDDDPLDHDPHAHDPLSDDLFDDGGAEDDSADDEGHGPGSGHDGSGSSGSGSSGSGSGGSGSGSGGSGSGSGGSGSGSGGSGSGSGSSGSGSGSSGSGSGSSGSGSGSSGSGSGSPGSGNSGSGSDGPLHEQAGHDDPPVLGQPEGAARTAERPDPLMLEDDLFDRPDDGAGEDGRRSRPDPGRERDGAR